MKKSQMNLGSVFWQRIRAADSPIGPDGLARACRVYASSRPGPVVLLKILGSGTAVDPMLLVGSLSAAAFDPVRSEVCQLPDVTQGLAEPLDQDVAAEYRMAEHLYPVDRCAGFTPCTTLTMSSSSFTTITCVSHRMNGSNFEITGTSTFSD